MPESNIDVRFAHSEGHTSLCYEDSGRYLVTCGSDGEVRVWDGLTDENPSSFQAGECAYAVTVQANKIYVTSDKNTVDSYTFPDFAPHGMVTRFTSTVNHISCSADGSFLASGAGDFGLKVVNLNDSSEKSFVGHEAPILSVALDSKGTFLASSSCDGSIRIWDASSGESIKTWKVLPKSNDFSASKTLGRVSWHPTDGKVVAVPVNKAIEVYSKNNWSLEKTISHSSIDEIITIVSFSPCGNYLAAACVNGKIIVWDYGKDLILKQEALGKDFGITDLAWCPKDGPRLAFADKCGQIGCILVNETSVPEKIPVTDDMFSALPEDDVDDLNFDSIRGSDLKSVGGDQDGSDDEIGKVKSKSRVSKIMDEDEDSSGIDLGQIKAAYEPMIFGSSQETPETEKKVEVPRSIIVEKVMSNMQQEAFQPSSTPIHFQHRFMLWNSVGLVRSYNTEEENSIDVEFHDVTLHHAIHVQNIHGHNLAALSEEALLLACPGEEEQSSKLVCMHFGTWDSSKEWTSEMPAEEKIMSIAAGRGWVGAVTDKMYLRLYSVGGLQLNILSIPGPVVCTAAMDKVLLVVYHQSAGLTDEQHLALLRFTIEKNSLSASQPHLVPLSVKSTLFWLGFTDEGTPCTVDSAGVVRLSTMKSGSFWSPVACLKEKTKGKSDHFFTIGVSEIQQQIRCIPCKGSRYPATVPRPAVSVLPFQMPFCDLSTDKGQNEETLCRQLMLKSLLDRLLKEDFQVDDEMEACQKRIIDTLMKLFALSARSNREFRALEIGQRLPTSQAVQGAIRYATQRHCMALAEQLGQVAHAKQQEEMKILSDDFPDDLEDEEPIEETPLPTRLNFNTPSNESVIQPKSMLSSVRRNSNLLTNRRSLQNTETMDMQTVENSGNVMSDGDSQDASQTKENIRIPSQGKVNPFKVSSQQKSGSSGLDAVLKDSMEQKSAKTTPPQAKFASNKAPKGQLEPAKKWTGLQLYIEDVKESLQEEHPELDETDIVKQAIAHFKALDKDEKQNWNEKAAGKSSSGDSSTKKRKPKEITTPPEGTKKPKLQNRSISAATSTKISQFMFAKKD